MFEGTADTTVCRVPFGVGHWGKEGRQVAARETGFQDDVPYGLDRENELISEV